MSAHQVQLTLYVHQQHLIFKKSAIDFYIKIKID